MKLERVMEYFSNNIGLDEREWKKGLTVDLRISGYELSITKNDEDDTFSCREVSAR